MADIIRAQSISSTGANRQNLYDILNTAQINNIALTDLSADALLGTIQSDSLAPSGMTHGQLWWDETWEVLRQFDSTTSLNCAIGPDMFQIPARAGCPIMQHHVVRIDMMATWALTDEAPAVNSMPVVKCCDDGLSFCEAIGTADATAASGDYVAINNRGFLQAWILGGDGHQLQEFLIGQSGYSGGCVGKSYSDDDIQGGAEVYLGMCIERTHTDASSRMSQSTFCQWYGPRRMGEKA